MADPRAQQQNISPLYAVAPGTDQILQVAAADKKDLIVSVAVQRHHIARFADILLGLYQRIIHLDFLIKAVPSNVQAFQHGALLLLGGV